MTTATPWIDRPDLALFTDLYELTMMQAYIADGMTDAATFSLSVRDLPRHRNYLLACGQDEVLSYLERLRFDHDGIGHLRSLGLFRDDFLDWLSRFRFSGEIHAVPEGTPVFANEPILEVTAPLPEAQLVETLIMNQIHLQTVLASKAVRVVEAAAGRRVVDFGARRMHGIDAALKAVRAFHIAGIAATSNVLAARLYGLPPTGTMAHSFIQAHDDEMAAFRSFVRHYPETVLLVDTYDTPKGLEHVIALSREIGDRFRVRAVRLDSGDLAALAGATRRMLDEAGLRRVEIFASSGLDEYRIADLVALGAPIDGFGVGTHLGVSRDAPGLDMAYKLCAYAGRGRLKLSSGKPVLPGRKQVFRIEEQGRAIRDIIARADETLSGRPLLRPMMRDGRRLTPDGETDLAVARRRAREEIDRLPPAVRGLNPAEAPYPVAISPALAAYRAAVIRSVTV